MTIPELHIETACRQVNYAGEKICGDCFLQRYLPQYNHTVIVLSDGLGHGIKANILSTLTASIFVGMADSDLPVEQIAAVLLKTLPVCRVRKISYSTFTLLDINHTDNSVRVVEFDNPKLLLVQNGELSLPERQANPYTDPATGKEHVFYTSHFTAADNDHILFYSDGISQSGRGSRDYPFGWGEENIQKYVREVLNTASDQSAGGWATALVTRAMEMDRDMPQDDTSCAVVRFRRRRRALLCSCPPSISDEISTLGDHILHYSGIRIVCGFPLARLLARHWDAEIEKDLTSTDPDLPPEWHVEGVDLVTEGLLTLYKTLEILENYDNRLDGRGSAYHICDYLLQADRIDMLVGMRRTNDRQSDGDLLAMRRKIIRDIAAILEHKFGKQVIIDYL